MLAFENIKIDTYVMVDMLLLTPVKIFLVYLLFFIIIRKFIFKEYEITMHLAIFQSFKICAYTFAAIVVFFFDFETKSFSLNLPEKMYLSTFLVGCFSAYEAISCLIDLPQKLFRK